MLGREAHRDHSTAAHGLELGVYTPALKLGTAGQPDEKKAMRQSLKMAGCAALWALGSAAHGQPATGGLVPGLQPYTPPPAPPGVTAPPRGAAGVSPKAPLTSPFASSPAQSAENYMLGPGDKLRIMVFGEDTLTGEFSVSGGGQISFPLIGDVQAGGRSVAQVRASIESALRNGYLKDPRVSAEVLTFRPYYILGEVAKPGEYPYSDGITVTNAVATAGGFSYRADRAFVFLKRTTASKEIKVRLTQELKLLPGDTVRVGERWF